MLRRHSELTFSYTSCADDNLKTVKIHLEQDLSKLPSRSIVQDRDRQLLQEVRIQRRLGFFEAALQKLDSMDQHQPRTLFHKVTVFESQGNFEKATQVHSVETSSPSDSNEHLLLRVVKSYLQCFTRGLWLQALQTTENALKSVARSPINEDSIKVMVHLVGF